MTATIDFASELIGRRSVTPDDAGCQQLIAKRLLAHGFEAKWFYFGDVSNVLITKGQTSPSLWFLGHTDVVPPGPEELWSSSPFELVEKDGLLIGRGVADQNRRQQFGLDGLG